VVNPLVNWIWVGFGVMALGTFIALLPESSFAFAAARVPGGAATTLPLLLLMLLPVATLRAQHVESAQTVPVIPRTELERKLGREIICMCGTCGRQLVGECSCSIAAGMRQEIADLVKQGKTEQQIVDHYITKYGSQEPLAVPIDTGFNRLAWLLPYLLGGAGACLVGTVAFRWSRHRDRTVADDEPSPPADPQLERKLDDELRDLD
jgi:cytochrome c-type biogenesis protein CcmH/NrfF